MWYFLIVIAWIPLVILFPFVVLLFKLHVWLNRKANGCTPRWHWLYVVMSYNDRYK